MLLIDRKRKQPGAQQNQTRIIWTRRRRSTACATTTATSIELCSYDVITKRPLTGKAPDSEAVGRMQLPHQELAAGLADAGHLEDR